MTTYFVDKEYEKFEELAKDCKRVQIPVRNILDPYFGTVKKELLISDRMVRHNRWTITHQSIFEYEGKIYSIAYNVSATESQDDDTFFDIYDIEDVYPCIEVEKSCEVIKTFVPKC